MFQHALAREVPAQEEINDLRHDLACALFQLLLGEIGDRMGKRQEFIVRHSPGFGHGPAGRLKHVGDDGRGGNATLFK